MDNQNKIDTLACIIDRHQDQLFRFAFFRTGSRELSQDIVQDVFLKMYGRMERIAGIENLKSYLYRSISNSCSDHMRRLQSNKKLPLDRALSQPDVEEDNLSEACERIGAMLEALPEEQAEVIRLHTVDGLTFAQIAEILQIPVATAKSRFRYGIEKLQVNLKNRRDEM